MDVDEDGEMLDHRQMREALTSVVSCSVASTAVRKAFVKVCNISEVPVVVTRAELMEGLVRDMRFMKSSQYKKKADDVPDNYIPDGEYRRDIYPSPYTRDYKEDGLRNILLRVKPTLPDFDRVRAIDLTGQLILGPDERLIELTENLRGCPVEVLSLGNNGITDIGLKQFAKICRSLRNLHTLHLNHNKFTDDGIEALFHADNFAPSMRTLNIAFNRIGKGSGWAIGRMFTPGMDAKYYYKHSADSFFVAFVPYLLYPGARALKKLDIADSGLSTVGMRALITLLMCTDSLESLNISRLPIEDSPLRYFILASIVGNRSLRTLMIKSCGLLRQEVKEIEAFITERESTSINVLVQALFVNEEDIFDFSNRDSNYHRRNFMKRFETMPWRDQLEFVRLIVGEKTRLEAMRLKDERYFTEVKYIPPPIPRPRMPTKGNAAFGGGVTGIPQFSAFLSNDEIAQSNISSIATRARQSVAQTKRAHAITESFSYPRSIKDSMITFVQSNGPCRDVDGMGESVTTNSTLASEEEPMQLTTLILSRDHSEISGLHRYLTTPPRYLTYDICKSIQSVLSQARVIDSLNQMVFCLQESATCPMIKGKAVSSVEEKFVTSVEDGDYRDILHVTSQKYVLPDSGARVSLLKFLLCWEKIGCRLGGQLKNALCELLELFDRWDDLYETRHSTIYDDDDADNNTYDGDDWIRPEPSEEELRMPNGIQMSLEGISSIQAEHFEALQQCIACLVCTEVIFFDEWKQIFAQRGDVVYNPSDGCSSCYKLGLIYPAFHLACHYVGQEYLFETVTAELIDRAKPMVEKPVKKKRLFKPKTGQRFNLQLNKDKKTLTTGGRTTAESVLPAIVNIDNAHSKSISVVGNDANGKLERDTRFPSLPAAALQDHPASGDFPNSSHSVAASPGSSCVNSSVKSDRSSAAMGQDNGADEDSRVYSSSSMRSKGKHGDSGKHCAKGSGKYDGFGQSHEGQPPKENC